jgi:hypothetical protein
MFERAKRVHALDHAATVIGKNYTHTHGILRQPRGLGSENTTVVTPCPCGYRSGWEYGSRDSCLRVSDSKHVGFEVLAAVVMNYIF